MFDQALNTPLELLQKWSYCNYGSTRVQIHMNGEEIVFKEALN